MNRRRYLSLLGTAGAGGVLAGVYLVDQGTIDIGEEAAVSGTVYQDAESFPFEALAGAEIFITIREEAEGDHRGGFTLRDPDGTYRLGVNPRGARLRVGVSVNDPDE